jgi:BirA family biotin operon repressor/biotin-[acetyl-CoA-carboxylase] ligase
MASMTTRHAILRLLADGSFRSGTDMGRALGITRAAVCKGIKGLDDAGLRIRRSAGRGYRLETPLVPLDERALRRALRRHGVSLGGRLRILEEIASTNRYLLDRAAELKSGDTCLAESQPAGRGRRGRSWVATPYHNLMLSMAWRFQGGPGLAAGLSLAAGVAVVQALEDYGINGAGLKWPNDILHGERKLAGLLADVQGEAAGPSLVVLGVGINGFLDEADAARIDQPWVDLARLTGATVDRNRLAALVIARLHGMFERFAARGFTAFRDAWEARHLHHGKAVRLLQGEREFCGTVTGIDENGALLVRDAHGQRRAFFSGDVSLRRA